MASPPRPSRGKRLVAGVVLMALVVSAATLVALHGSILEAWYLFRLESADPATRQYAAVQLGELRSGRAVPKLVRLLESDRSALSWVLGPLLAIGEKGAAGLRELLAAQGDELRLDVFRRIRELGPRAVSACPLLVAQLASRNDRVLDVAISALAAIGPGAAPELARAMRTGNAHARVMAMRPLVDMESPPRSLIPVLIESLGADDVDVRAEASDALARFGAAAMAPLLEALESDDETRRRTAAWCLSGVGAGAQEPSVLATLAHHLQHHRDPYIRRQMTSLVAGASRIIFTPEPGKGAVAALTAALRDDDVDVRLSAAKMLDRIDASPPEALAALVDIAEQAEARRQRLQALSLLSRWPTPDAAIPSLVRMLADEDRQLRATVLRVLGTITSDAAAVPGPLLAALSDENILRREGAAQTLVEGGEQFLKEALEKLKAGLRHEDPAVRERCAAGLGPIWSHALDGHDALIGALHDSVPAVRQAAARSLGRSAFLLEQVITALIEACRDSDAGVRREAVAALGLLDPVSEAPFQCLLAAAEDSEAAVRVAAVQALTASNDDGELVLPRLFRLLRDDSPDVRWQAAEAIVQSPAWAFDPGLDRPDPLRFLRFYHTETDASVRLAILSLFNVAEVAPPDALELLTAALRDESSSVRRFAANVLGRVGAPARPAVPALVAALSDSSKLVRAQAASALGRIGDRRPAVIDGLRRALERSPNTADWIRSALESLAEK